MGVPPRGLHCVGSDDLNGDICCGNVGRRVQDSVSGWVPLGIGLGIGAASAGGNTGLGMHWPAEPGEWEACGGKVRVKIAAARHQGVGVLREERVG